ncbi:MAG: tRNA preQ1(34) S-adenosylmethionine ribosyltransferase-isomerase QueA [Desulfotomaculum sp.]|nr:tRNA preQ1(34) S-adenosylmethionine ribosyltransferase-isomerase QueA [Desulfotomaculum sp.]
MYKTSDYDYYLPEELIAQEPLNRRDQSRLMVLHRNSGVLEHRHFNEIIKFLRPGDTLVINETKVLPARLYGKRKATGAKIEVLLLKQQTGTCWEALVKPGKRAKVGDTLTFTDGKQVLLEADIIDKTEAGGRVLEFKYTGNFLELLDRIGTMPLPPYIKKELQDRDRYQTVYARKEGSAAAPTAGLHFTEELLHQVQQKGITVARLLLHVGLGTFRPVKVEDIREHKMHQEYYEVTKETADIINAAKERGNKVVAVGTTSVRTLETAAGADGKVKPGSGWTDIFIYPGYKFKCVDALITNFHLPKSTLMMLVAAFAGKDKIMKAYEEAVKEKYRFFSFGDAMLII